MLWKKFALLFVWSKPSKVLRALGADFAELVSSLSALSTVTVVYHDRYYYLFCDR